MPGVTDSSGPKTSVPNLEFASRRTAPGGSAVPPVFTDSKRTNGSHEVGICRTQRNEDAPGLLCAKDYQGVSFPAS